MEPHISSCLGSVIGNQHFRLCYLCLSYIVARYAKEKLTQLESLNPRLDILRYQTRLLLDFELISVKRYEYAGQLINAIGTELGGWIKQQRQRL